MKATVGAFLKWVKHQIIGLLVSHHVRHSLGDAGSFSEDWTLSLRALMFIIAQRTQLNA